METNGQICANSPHCPPLSLKKDCTQDRKQPCTKTETDCPCFLVGTFRTTLCSSYLLMHRQIDSDLEIVSTIFSIRAVSVVLAPLVAGWLFSLKWALAGNRRLAVLSLSHLVIATSWFLLPFAQTYAQLAASKIRQCNTSALCGALMTSKWPQYDDSSPN